MTRDLPAPGAQAAPSSSLGKSPTTRRSHRAARRAVPIAVADLTIVLVGNALPGPLLPAYRAAWRLAPLPTTLIFAIYVAGVMGAILFAGRAADQVGPGPVLAAALGFGAASGLIALVAPAVGWLYLARILQGIAAALAGGGATVAITEASGDPGTGARWTACGTTGGIALGLLLAGVIGQVSGSPLTWSWAAYLILLGVAAAATLSIDEVFVLRGRPQFSLTRPGLPDRGLITFVRAIAGVSLAFGCMGLLAGLGPTLARAIGIRSVLGDAAVAALAYVISGVTLVAFGGRVRTAVPGLIALLVGLVPLFIAVRTASTAWLLTGVAVIGLGNGLTFRISLAIANHLAPPHRRFEIVSTYNVAMYGGIVSALLATAVLADVSSLRTAASVVTGAIAVGVLVIVASELTARGSASATARGRRFTNDTGETP